MKKKHYVNNSDMLKEIHLSIKQDRLTENLGRMLLILAHNYASKHNFANYTFRDDMESQAVTQIVFTWRNFDPTKSNNPFAFFTQCIFHSFIHYLSKEKKHRNIRDALLLTQGLNPSDNYKDDY